jgi:SAM-dependent methyltransferase
VEDFYRKFGKYYDQIYSSFYDYKKECDNLEMIFSKHSMESLKEILDIGCGTGTHAIELAKRGYKVTGIDISSVMIEEAKKKAEKKNLKIDFKLQDMREITLPQKFDAAICLFGGFGYLHTSEDLNGFFRGVKKCLKGPSLIIFEYWNVKTVKPGFRSWVKADDEEKGTTVIRLSESDFDEENRIISLNLDFYVFSGKEVIDRFTEAHELLCHDYYEIENILRDNRFELIELYGKDMKSQTLKDEIEEEPNILVVAKVI